LVEDVVVTLHRSIVRSSARACSVFAFGCGRESQSATPRQAGTPKSNASGVLSTSEFTVDTMTVQRPLELAAQLYVEHDAVIVARAQGTVDSLFAELGDRVTAGKMLARLESADQEIALANAEGAYENLEHVAARTRQLAKTGSASPADSEQVVFQLRQAEIARRKARRDLELTRVVAPFDGLITARSVRPRRFVAVGDTLFRLTESAPLFARIRVPEASARLVRIGEDAMIIGAAGGRSAAAIVHAAPIVDAASGTREVVLRVTRPDASLIAGANVVVQLGHERRRVVSVAREAIAPEGYAVVVENGRSTLRPVTVGGDLGNGRVEVLSGLSAGERLARPAR
jgi:membrane fusion protein (multidrug efflux system)